MKVAEAVREDVERHDARFAAWKAKNPGGRFADFSASYVASSLGKGRAHTTLGEKLVDGVDWRDAGRQAADLILSQVTLPPEAGICDYGCGSLRVGVHFIERQAPGQFVGLDVTTDFIDIGKSLLGPEVLTEKRPVLGTIADRRAEAIAAEVAVVYAFHVSSHVHPDEWDAFCETLLAIAHRPGARLLIHAMMATEPVRFQRSGWARPREEFERSFRPLRLVRDVPMVQFERNGVDLATSVMVFERDG